MDYQEDSPILDSSDPEGRRDDKPINHKFHKQLREYQSFSKLTTTRTSHGVFLELMLYKCLNGVNPVRVTEIEL